MIDNLFENLAANGVEDGSDEESCGDGISLCGEEEEERERDEAGC